MQPTQKKMWIVAFTFITALLFVGAVFWVTQVSAAGLAEPAAPDNPINQYPATWVVVVGNTGTLHTVNTANNIVYGPFLTHEIGSESGGLYDVAVTPNGKTALVSNFGDYIIGFVDISNPIAPSLISTVTTIFSTTEEGSPPKNEYLSAEDIDITRDGKYALVTDGGYSPYIVILDIASRSIITGVYLGENNAVGVSVGPNGTVVVPDYNDKRIASYHIDDAGNLTYGGTYTYAINAITGEIDPTGIQYTTSVTSPWVLPKPVNVGISPDGKTVILCDAMPYSSSTTSGEIFDFDEIGVFRIVSPGVLSFTQAITGIASGNYQSVAFSPTGDKAYLFGNGGGNVPQKQSRLTVLNIDGPGQVSLNNEVAAIIPRYAKSALFGVDSIAVINNKAYIGHETINQFTDTLKSSVHVVDLKSFDVMTLTLEGIPTDAPSSGVAAIPYFIYVPFLIQP